MSSNKSYVSEDILNKFTDNQSIRFNNRYFVSWIEMNVPSFNEIISFKTQMIMEKYYEINMG